MPDLNIESEAYDEYGADEELLAECRYLGGILKDPTELYGTATPLTPLSFCSGFSAAIYYVALASAMAWENPSIEELWERVSAHPDAQDYGLEHLRQMASEAGAEIAESDALMLHRRGLRGLLRLHQIRVEQASNTRH